MEFYQVINNRRTVRDLTAEPIPADVLERIIAAGIHAPTYDHRREWEFVILREETTCFLFSLLVPYIPLLRYGAALKIFSLRQLRRGQPALCVFQ